MAGADMLHLARVYAWSSDPGPMDGADVPLGMKLEQGRSAMTTLQRPDVRSPKSVSPKSKYRRMDWLIGSIAVVIGGLATYLFFHPANATLNFFGTAYVVEDLHEGWRLGLAALSAGIFGTWFAWISNRWSKLGSQMDSRTTWWATAAVVVLAIAMAFLAIWIF